MRHQYRHILTWRRFFSVIVGGVILILVLLALQPTVSITRLRTTLEILASEALGRPVSCTALRFTCSLSPRVTLENLNVGASPHEHRLRVGRAVIQARLWPLVTRGRIQLDQVILEGVHLQLAETESPAPPSPEPVEHLPPEPESEPAPSSSFTLEEIGFFRLADLSVSRRGEGGTEAILLEVPDISGALPVGEGATLHGRMRVGGHTWKVHGRSDGPPANALEEKPAWQGQVWMVAAPAHHVMVDVEIGDGDPGPEVTVQLLAQGEQIDELGVMNHLAHHPHGPYRLHGTLAWTPGRWNGDGWELGLGNMQWLGSARVTMVPGEDPVITTSLQGGPLDLRDWVAKEEAGWQAHGMQAALQASTRGHSVSNWLEHLRGELTLREVMAVRPIPGKEDVEIRMDQLHVQRADAGWELQLQGNLAGIPADAQARVTVDHPQQWDVSVQGHLGPDPLTLTGRVDAAGKALDLDAQLEVTGDEIGTFLPWLHVDSGAVADLPYHVQVGFALGPDHMRLDLRDLQLGASQLSAQVSIPRASTAGPKQWVLHADRLDIDEWKDLAASLKPARSDADAKTTGVVLLETQVWPSGLVLDDGDVEVKVARLDAGLHHVQNLSCQASVRNGKIPSSAFSFRLGATRFDGAVELDGSGKEPYIALDAEARDVDVRALLGQYQYETGQPLHADRFSAVVRAHGNRLGELLQNGTLKLDAKGVHGIMPHPMGGNDLSFAMEHVGVNLHQGQPLQLNMNVQFRKVPVEATLVLNREVPGGPGRPAGDTMWLPMAFEIHSPGVQWSGKGFLPLPFDLANMELELNLGGDSLKRLSPVFDLPLPDLGPYQAQGQVHFVDGALLLDHLDVTVGSSRFTGRIDMQPDRRPDTWRFEVESPSIQLTDFSRLWIPDPEAAPSTEEDTVDAPAWYDRMGGVSIDLDVQELLMGEDHWGAGTVGLRGRDGLLHLNPFDLDGPQGRIHLVMEQGRVENNRHFKMKGTVEDLQLGALSRLTQEKALEDADASGELTFVANLWESTAPSDPSWSGLEGELAFSLVPRNISTALFDLWAAGLIRSVLPTLAQKPAPQFNCVSGSITAQGGRLQMRRLELDTTRIRVKGEGHIDLAQGSLDLTLKPRPKQLAFISLATPVKVEGTLNEPDIKVEPKSLVATFFKVYMWFITFFQGLFSDPVPSLQGPACGAEAMQELDAILNTDPGPATVP